MIAQSLNLHFHMNAIITFRHFDMRTPIQVIHGVTEMFENRIDSLSANERPTPNLE